MNRRTFLRNSALAGSALYTPYPFDEPKEVSEEYSLQRLYNQEWMKPSPEHPNIILITTDHMRVDNIAANGNEAMQTPHLDGMAKNGASFLRCHCPSPVCMPSRASLFTGRYPSNHDVRTNGVPLSEDEITITHILANEGYYTGQIGKLHFLPHYDRNHRGYHPPYGFDEMRLSDEPGCYDDAYGRWLEALGPKAREQGRVRMPGKKEARKWKTCYPFEGPDDITHAWWVGEETINFIKRNKNRPFFMHTGFYAPHPPLNPPQSQLDRYNGVKLPSRLYRKNEGNTMPKSYRNTFIRNSRHSEGYWEEYKKYFYAMVSNVDVQMGRILETLKNEKILDNTLIIFTSDHGDYLGDHNHVSKGAPVYKGMMEVPMVIRGPAIPKGKLYKDLTELTDIVPTLLDYLNINHPRGIKGQSFLPLLKGKKYERDLVYAEFAARAFMKTIRTEEAKYMCNANGEEILFDLQKDPDEFADVSEEKSYQSLLNEMRKNMLVKACEVMEDKPEQIVPY